MIIWLASYPKSGNTLLRSILSSYFYSKEGEFSFKNLNYISQFPLASQFMSAGIDINNDEEVFKKAEPVIDCYSKKVKLIGPCGSGQLTKMMNQMCIAGTVQGLSEAINFGINAGLDMDKVMETISKGAAQSWQMENRYRTMTDDKFDYGFAIDWMRKDLKIAIEEAKRNGSPVPITEIIDGYYAEVQEMGGNRWDSSGLIARLKKKK